MSFGTVTCESARELISARADDELAPAELRALDKHVDGCTACAGLATRLAALDRRFRIRTAEPVPDLVAVVSSRLRPAVLGRGGWLRPALAWVAAVMFAQHIVALVMGSAEGTETHVARHLGAFGVALSIGFAYVAWRPHRAYGMLPFVAALVATTVASTGFDVIDGGRGAIAEATHTTELAGLVLLWMIAGSPGWHGWRAVTQRLHLTS